MRLLCFLREGCDAIYTATKTDLALDSLWYLQILNRNAVLGSLLYPSITPTMQTLRKLSQELQFRAPEALARFMQVPQTASTLIPAPQSCV